MAPKSNEKRIDPEDGLAYTCDELSAKYTGRYKKKDIAVYWDTCKPTKGSKAKAKATESAEKRIDPEDGLAYTWEEISNHYAGKFKKKDIAVYWETCKPTKKAKAKAAAKVVEPKAKAKAKAKVKAKATGSTLPKKGVKLYYWPARGRGEQVRLALATTDVAFEDVSFDMSSEDEKAAFFAKCRELGGNATNNTPMLEVKGKFYTQSVALVKFICACGGLGTDSPKVAFRIDNIIGHVEDLRTLSYKPIKMMGGGEKEKAGYLEILPKHLGNFERLLGERKFFADVKMTAADISVYDLLDTMVVTQVPDALASYPKLSAFRERMSKVSGIEKWHASEQHKKLWAFPEL
jgi:glutathione S-transferase